MWRLIAFIIVFAVFLGFICLNLVNRCNINFGFGEFKDVPVFITVFVSFVLGMLFALPFAFLSGRKRKKSSQSKTPAAVQVSTAAPEAKAKKRWSLFAKKEKPQKPAEKPGDKEDYSSYGIN